MRWFTTRLTLLCVAAFTAAALPCRADPVPVTRSYLKSAYDFELHMKLHIRRARVLALSALDLPRYRDLDPRLVRRFMTLHDQSKINRRRQFLRAHQLDPNERSILDRLYSFVGQNESSLIQKLGQTEGKRRAAEFRALVDQLNGVDNEVGREFFAKHGLLTADGKLTETARRYLELEKVADLVDRGMSPVTSEEMGKPILKASAWFKRLADKEPAGSYSEMAHAAEALEARYAQITRGLAFEDLGPRSTCVYGQLVQALDIAN